MIETVVHGCASYLRAQSYVSHDRDVSDGYPLTFVLDRRRVEYEWVSLNLPRFDSLGKIERLCESDTQ